MKKEYIRRIWYLVAGFIIFNAMWHVLAVSVMMKALPEPWQVYSAYGRAMDNGICGHALSSLRRVAVGGAIALVIASAAGIAMGYNRTINRLLSPVLYLSYPIPKLALLPVIMIFLGIGEASKIMIIVLIVVFQLIVSIRDAVLAIPEENYDVFVSLRAGTWAKIRNITLPAAVPAILSSLRVSTGIAISVLIVAETYGTDKGLGFYVVDSWMRADYIQMYFGIFVLSLMGFSIFLWLDFAQKYMCRWKT